MKRYFFLCLAFLLIAAASLGAQVPDFPPVEQLTPETVFTQLTEPLYVGLTVLFGYLSAFIPGVKRLAPFYRVLAFALATGLGLFLFGVSFWKLALSYFLASGLYVTFFKNILPSPKAARSAAG